MTGSDTLYLSMKSTPVGFAISVVRNDTLRCVTSIRF